MKTIFSILALTIISSSAFADMTFKRDSRPVDGDMKLLVIKNENSRMEASVKLISAIVSRMSGQSKTETIIDEVGMECKISKKAGSISMVYCMNDLRPADGAKTEVIVKKNARTQSFDVTLKTSFYSQMTGEEIKQSKIVASDLNLI